jgi:TRAP-type uncharacterized transport system substrate-binding protein
MSRKLPLWLRLFLLVGVTVFAAGAGLFAYRYYTRPVTLTVAVGSIDGEAATAMSALASELASMNAPVRLKVIDSGTTLEAAAAFSAATVDLAVVRSDVGDLSQAQAVVIVSHLVVLIIAPPGSSLDSMDNLKGRAVGVVGGAANAKIVDMLTKEYNLASTKVVFKNLALTDVRQAVQSKQVSALLVAIPLSEKYLSLVRGFFHLDHNKKGPVLIPIESAGAIAEAERAFESFDVPKGTLRGSPPVPEDDLTTLRTSLYLVAHKKLSSDLVTSLTQAIMSARRNLLREQPIFAQITAPSTDLDAYLPLHAGAAAVYNSTTLSFMDQYGNWIYLTPMILGGVATLLAAAWKFLGIGNRATEGPLDSLYALARRIRKVDSEAELSDIEEEIDGILKAERSKSAGGDESAVDDATLNVAAHRLESLIHDRRTLIAKRPAVALSA